MNADPSSTKTFFKTTLVQVPHTLYTSKPTTTGVPLQIGLKNPKKDQKVLCYRSQMATTSCLSMKGQTLLQHQLITTQTVIPYWRRKQGLPLATRRGLNHSKKKSIQLGLTLTKTPTWGLLNVLIREVLAKPGVSNLLQTRTWSGRPLCSPSRRILNQWKYQCRIRLTASSKNPVDLPLAQNTRTSRVTQWIPEMIHLK